MIRRMMMTRRVGRDIDLQGVTHRQIIYSPQLETDLKQLVNTVNESRQTSRKKYCHPHHFMSNSNKFHLKCFMLQAALCPSAILQFQITELDTTKHYFAYHSSSISSRTDHVCSNVLPRTGIRKFIVIQKPSFSTFTIILKYWSKRGQGELRFSR